MTQQALPPSDELQQFRKRLQAQVRENIGSLLGEEELQALVKRAVEAEFFTPAKVRNPRYGEWNHPQRNVEWIESPSRFTEAVREAAEPLIREQVALVVQERRDDIVAACREYLAGDRMLVVAAALIGHEVRQAMHAYHESTMNALRSAIPGFNG